MLEVSRPGAARDPQPAILLVDDDSFMLGLQSHLLAKLGYRHVDSVGTGSGALAILLSGERTPDVIVCDLNMPGMDGVEFLQAVNASAFAGSVILLSGEGLRIMHTVQKLLGGGRLKVLGALVGVEALVRWNHPRHGLIFPDAFIGIAEECGAIDALTAWVLGDAARQLARWLTQGVRMHVAVNVSMDNLASPDFASRAARIVRSVAVSPADITLEITESRAMSPSPVPLECLVRLRLLRFKLSIDDFGTGHSSLAQLRDVPFTELKIDRGFVHGARSNQIIRPMLEGSIGMAKKLGMVAVAEGVETADDFEFLRETECDVAQGYYIGRPVAADALPAWLADWQGRRTLGVVP